MESSPSPAASTEEEAAVAAASLPEPPALPPVPALPPHPPALAAALASPSLAPKDPPPGGFTRVYAAGSSAGGDDSGPRYYAVRKGINVENCIFLRWEDCALEVLGAGDDIDSSVDFEEFASFDEARDFIEDGFEEDTSKPKAKRRKTSSGDNRVKPRLWDLRFEELRRFKEEHGHCLVPSSKKKDDASKLSRWVSRQRLEYRYFQEDKPTAMTQARVDALTEIGFAFRAWEAKREMAETGDGSNEGVGGKKLTREERYEQTWQDQFENLLKFKAENGDCDVPGNDPTMGKWIQQQRILANKFKEGRPSEPLTEEKYDKLVDAGFPLRAKRGPKGVKRRQMDEESNTSWDKMYGEMKEYHQQNGDCLVPQTPYTPLRGWVLKQRTEYRRLRDKEPSHLTARRVQLLNDLGFEWNNKTTLKWADRLEQLGTFKEEHGHCVVPRQYEGITGLGKWVAQQRNAYKLMKEGKKSTMTQERAKSFDDLGMVWSILKQPEKRAERMPWSERLQQLLAYKEEQGHTVVPQHYPGGLGNWVHQQRTHYVYMKTGRKSLMTPEKAIKLTDAGFVFAVKKGKNRSSHKNSNVEIAAARAEAAGALRKTGDSYEVANSEPRAVGGGNAAFAAGGGPEAPAGGDYEANVQYDAV